MFALKLVSISFYRNFILVDILTNNLICYVGMLIGSLKEIAYYVVLLQTEKNLLLTQYLFPMQSLGRNQFLKLTR